MDSKVAVGAHVVAYVNGKPYGRVAGVDVHLSEQGREIRGVDWLPPVEHAPGPATGTVGLTVYRLHRDGGAEGAGFTAAWPDLARAKYFSLLLVDRFTDTVLFRFDRCKLGDQQWKVGNGFVLGTLSAQVLDFQNEVEPS